MRPRARPLRVQLRLRPQIEDLRCGKAGFDRLRGKGGELSVDIGQPRRAAARRLVDHVDGVALADKIIRPAGTAVGRAHPVGRRLRRAMDQHQRIALARMARDQHLDIHLAVHQLLAGRADIGAADIKIPAASDRRLVVTRHCFACGLGCLGGAGDHGRREQACEDHRRGEQAGSDYSTIKHGFLPGG